jgi:Spy/CpxP family protein refolding chaperone
MTKLMSIIAASALALSLSGAAFAADPKMDQPAYPKAQDQTGAPKTQDQGATPAEQSKRYEEYLLALKKCQDLQDAAMQKCIEQARQKYNRM